ncbi:MAG: hypothetical protein ACPG49_03455 [Chitinophagales bacterium]
MQTPASPIKFHLAQLKDVFGKLLKIKTLVDEDEVIAVNVFYKAEQELKYLEQLEAPSLSQIKTLENYLICLKRYLHQFEQYSKITKSFFLKASETLEKSVLEGSYHFLAAKNMARQLFHYFIEGTYFKIGLQKSVDKLKHLIASFWEQMPSLEVKTPIGDFDIFKAISKHSPDSFDLNAYLSEHIDISPNRISATRIKQIKEGYYYLYRKSLVNKIEGKEYKLAKRLTLLETGLRKQNEQVIYKALRLMQQLIKPTAITSPTNYMNTQQKLIKLTGLSEPDSTIILVINRQRPLKMVVTKDEKFVFNNIELKFGDNTLICYNRDFLFLDNHKYHLHIHLERHYPFIGMHDPLTQKDFQESEAQIIMRCTTCKNYEYDFSVEENNNLCVFPKCEGRSFWNWEDTEYWMEF